MSTTTAATSSRVDMPVVGMHCAACAVRIEGALGQAPGVSKAAVYYHYPTIAAIQLALGRSFDTDVSTYLIGQRLKWPCDSWPQYLAAGTWSARDWFNANRAACETLLGPLLGRQNKLAGFEYNTLVGAALLEGLNERGRHGQFRPLNLRICGDHRQLRSSRPSRPRESCYTGRPLDRSRTASAAESNAPSRFQ